jgi:hypothetical protein
MDVKWIEITDVFNNAYTYSIDEENMKAPIVDRIIIQENEIIIKGTTGLYSEPADKVYLMSNLISFVLPKDSINKNLSGFSIA